MYGFALYHDQATVCPGLEQWAAHPAGLGGLPGAGGRPGRPPGGGKPPQAELAVESGPGFVPIRLRHAYCDPEPASFSS